MEFQSEDPLLGSAIGNITYIAASRCSPQQLRRKNKKWQKMMKFPHITQCLNLANDPKLMDYNFIMNCDKSFDIICDKFVICDKFRQNCQKFVTISW